MKSIGELCGLGALPQLGAVKAAKPTPMQKQKPAAGKSAPRVGHPHKNLGAYLHPRKGK